MPTFKEMPDMGWEPDVLSAKSTAIKRNALIGLVVGIVGIFFFGILLGPYALYSARDALIDIDVYGVSRGYRWVARAAQVFGGFALTYWIATFLLSFLLNK